LNGNRVIFEKPCTLSKNTRFFYTGRMMMGDGEEGFPKGWVGSWAVDRCQAWRGGFDREGGLVMWLRPTATLSLRRTHCDA